MDVFKKNLIDEDIIAEYYIRSKRKKEDEEWLKEHGNLIKEKLKNTPKSNIGDYTVTISTSDVSYFDEEKVLEYLSSSAPHLVERCTKKVLNSDELANCIEENLVDLTKLKEVAWVQKQTQRLLIKKKGGKDD